MIQYIIVAKFPNGNTITAPSPEKTEEDSKNYAWYTYPEAVTIEIKELPKITKVSPF